MHDSKPAHLQPYFERIDAFYRIIANEGAD